MVFTARCVCTKHSTWSHGNVSPDALRIADPEELRFCEVDSSKNKGRKRKICLACRGRLAAEIKCMRLEVRLYFCNCHVLFSHVSHISVVRQACIWFFRTHKLTSLRLVYGIRDNFFLLIYFICLLFRINKPVSTPRKICAMYQLSAKVKLTTPNIHQAVYLRLPAPNMCKFWNCLYDRTGTRKKGLSKLWGQRPSRLLKTVLTNLCIITRKTYLNLWTICWIAKSGSPHLEVATTRLTRRVSSSLTLQLNTNAARTKIWVKRYDFDQQSKPRKFWLDRLWGTVEFLWVGVVLLVTSSHSQSESSISNTCWINSLSTNQRPGFHGLILHVKPSWKVSQHSPVM